MGIEDLIHAEAEATEHNPDAPIPANARVSRGHARSKTLQVRLNDEELATLTTLAERRGVPVSTLARDILLGHLAGPTDSPRAIVARIRAELEALESSVA